MSSTSADRAHSATLTPSLLTQLTRKHYPHLKRTSHHLQVFVNELLLLLAGIRPAGILVELPNGGDDSVGAGVTLQQLLTEVSAASGVSVHIIADAAHEHCFVITSKSLATLIQTHTQSIVYIDASAGLQQPIVCDTATQSAYSNAVERVLQHLQQQLATQSAVSTLVLPRLQLDAHPHLSLSTIAGGLLGYPVVYVTDSISSSTHRNCLSMQPLKRVSPTATIASTNNKATEVEICAFTVPAACYSQCVEVIDVWFGKLVARISVLATVKQQMTLTDVQLTRVAL